MHISSISTLFTTQKIEETKNFYVNYLNAEVVIDTGSYLILAIGNSQIHFMNLNSGFNEYSKFDKFSNSYGLVYNLLTDNSKEVYDFLNSKNINTLPFVKYKFGDEGFIVQDPNGINLFICSEYKK